LASYAISNQNNEFLAIANNDGPLLYLINGWLIIQVYRTLALLMVRSIGYQQHGALIDTGGYGTILIENVAVADRNDDDFIF